MERLSLEDTEQLLRAWRTLGDEDAFNLLINANLGLVKKIANKFMVYKLQFDELVPVGVEGLINAINKFDFEHNKIEVFSSFISKAIVWKMIEFKNLEEKIRMNEVSLYGNLPNVNGDSSSTFDEVLGYEEDYTFIEVSSEVRKALELLRPRERKIIMLKYGFNDNVCLTDEEIGKILGCTKAAVGQMKNKALARLREPDAKEILEGL